MRKKAARWGTVTAAAVCIAMVGAPSAFSADPTPGTRLSTPAEKTSQRAGVGMSAVLSERGRISKSVSATTNSTPFTVSKPAGATVRTAILATASLGYASTPLTTPLQLGGSDVAMTNEIASNIDSYNYVADVTSIVKPLVDGAAAGNVSISYNESHWLNTDGSILVVVYDDPSVPGIMSVTALYGALQPAGDTFTLALSRPVDVADPATKLEVGLGISFSYQEAATQQFTVVDVNGTRLTSAAGGEDDGYGENGGLITVGGLGDSAANPADPLAAPTNPRSDDELYDLRPFVATGDTQIDFTTSNPSNDDNVFLAVFETNPPVAAINNSSEVAVGDYVWLDTDADGVQEVGESGIPGVRLTVGRSDGQPALNADGTTPAPAVTDGAGAYSFAGLEVLPAGVRYVVTLDNATVPATMQPTLPGVGDPELDSSTGTATSRALLGGESDLSLDFGFREVAETTTVYVQVDRYTWANRAGGQRIARFDNDGLLKYGEDFAVGTRKLPGTTKTSRVFTLTVPTTATPADILQAANAQSVPAGFAAATTTAKLPDAVATRGAVTDYFQLGAGARPGKVFGDNYNISQTYLGRG